MPDTTQFRPDQVHPSVFIAEGARIVGDVTIGEESSVWFNAVLRGDCDSIRIGRRTNIQDNAMLHVDPGVRCVVGDGVTIGHLAIVHGAEIGDNVVIGMHSVVMSGAKVGANSIIGVGAVVTEGVEIPPGSLVMGLPGKVKRQLTDMEIEGIRGSARRYVQNAKEFSATRMGGTL